MGLGDIVQAADEFVVEGKVVLIVVCPVDEVFVIVELALGVALVEVGGVDFVLDFVSGELFGEGDRSV